MMKFSKRKLYLGYILTGVHPDAEFELFIGPVADAESHDSVPQRQTHTGDFPCVVGTVSYRKSRHHHVRVTDGLHLRTRRSILLITPCLQRKRGVGAGTLPRSP